MKNYFFDDTSEIQRACTEQLQKRSHKMTLRYSVSALQRVYETRKGLYVKSKYE